MILITHISIAIISVIYTGFVLFAPSQTKLRVSGALMGVTIVSGTYLVLSLRTNMLKACLTGLLYTGLMLAGIIIAQRKLAVESNN